MTYVGGWSEESEDARVLSVVRAHPYRSDMEPIAYVEMIAVLAGLIKAEDSVLQKRRATK